MAQTYVNPMVTVAANLAIHGEEVIGPKTNQRTVAMLHPDRHQTSATRAFTEHAARAAQRVCWLPDKNLTNMEIKHLHIVPSAYPNDMLQGENGQYVKAQYADVVLTGKAPANEFGAITVPEDRQYLMVLEADQN